MSVRAVADVTSPGLAQERSRPKYYPFYVLGLLTAVQALAVFDIQILALLVTPVRAHLQITDTQMGLLLAAGSAGVSSILALPLARYADAHSRRGMIGAGVVLWSLGTAGCGLATTFEQLLAMRLCISIGAAALLPAVFSLLSDYFPPERRGIVFSVLQTGMYVAIGGSFLVGGLLTGWASQQELWDLPILGTRPWWQAVFLGVGVVGALCALLLWTVEEPLRKDGPTQAVSLRKVWAFVRANAPALACHNLGFAILMLSTSTGVWIPTFFVRQHGWAAADFGKVYGPVALVVLPAAVVVGGWWASRLTARGRKDAFLRVAWITAFAWLPFGMAYPFMSDPRWAL
ncbi:MAG: MFS transporter, partial [Longimicrobiales bacterium]